MTYPLIGNTGINREDIESRKPFLEAFVVRRMSPIPSNWRSSDSLDDYLIEHRIPVISDIDTRALVRHIRLKGSMRGIVSRLVHCGARVTVVPSSTPAEDVLQLNPDGIFLSNGPGDPEAVDYAIRNVRNLLGKKPIFGICLGHQIMGLAFGGKTFKLKFGHHGGNHPVLNVERKQVEITAQNHGFAVDPESLNLNDLNITHINLNDNT